MGCSNEARQSQRAVRYLTASLFLVEGSFFVFVVGSEGSSPFGALFEDF